MAEFFEVMTAQLLQTTWLEAVAVFFGLLSVWYSKEENILVYPTGIISVAIYMYLTVVYKLYADTGINTYYLIMSIYGWYHWLDAKGGENQIPITRMTRKERWIGIGLFAFSFVFIRGVLAQFTDSDVPSMDALTTAFALVGMWLMARKKLENWIAWILTDIASVPLYIYKGLPLTAFQFLVFAVLATWGYFTWRKSMMRTA